MSFSSLFPKNKPVIACIHLAPLPGAPGYRGDMDTVFDQALKEAVLFEKSGVHALIVENFRDKPFFPESVPAETVAAMATVTREVVRAVTIPVGVNVLRNDAHAGIAVATCAQAEFIRINIHMGAVVSEQGIIQGKSHETLRLRRTLRSPVLIFADVGVKHAAPLANRGLGVEAKDLEERGGADAIIVSGKLTGSETNPDDVDIVRANTRVPILIGSGVTPENIHKVLPKADGLIVGSYFKKRGIGENHIDPARVRRFMKKMSELKKR